MPPETAFDGVAALRGLWRQTTLCAGDRPLIMALYAYFDESGKWHDAQGYICLCGYLADEVGWAAFTDRWNHLLRKRGFQYLHMTKFYSECKKKGIDKTEAGHILTDFIEVIRQSELVQFSVGLDGRYFRHKYSVMGKRKVDPALFAVQRILRQIRDASSRWTHDEYIPRLLLTFDEDYEYSIETYKTISRLRKIRPELMEMVRAITFADDKIFSPLQAADILANLTNAYWRDLIASEEEAPTEPDPLLKLLVSEPEHDGLMVWQPAELWSRKVIDARWDEELQHVKF
jgi:hypothetical protein